MEEKVHDRTITNKYLNVERKIKGGTPLEIKIKAEAQQAKWSRQEKLVKDEENVESLKELAEFKTQKAENTCKACESILKTNLCSAVKLDWASFYDDRLPPPFVFKEHPPRYEQVAKDMSVPRKGLFNEILFPSIKKKRLTREEAARAAFQEQMRVYNDKKASAQASYEIQRASFLSEQSEFNRTVDQLQLDVEKGRPDAVASLVRIALAYLELPDIIEIDFDIHYHEPEKLVLINTSLPSPQAIPRTMRFEYHEETSSVSPVEMDTDSFEKYYESVLLQIVLSAVHRIFIAIPDRQIHKVAYNGLAGDTKSCILTCKVSRDLFDSTDLARTALDKAFQAMQGRMVKPLSSMTPVEPLVWTARTSLQSPPTNGGITQPDSPHQASAYQPGEIKNAANNLLLDLLDQIEKDLSKQAGNNDVVH